MPKGANDLSSDAPWFARFQQLLAARKTTSALRLLNQVIENDLPLFDADSQIAEDLPPVILAADKDLPYAEVIKVIDLIYAVGIRRVSLDTKHTPSP